MRSVMTFTAIAMSLAMADANAQTLNPGETMIRGSAPVTFRVSVKLSNLLPDVAHVRVHCMLQQGSVPIVHGETTSQVSSSGNFDGVLTVPVNILYPNQSEAKIPQVNKYDCSLQLLNNANPPQVWAPDKTNAPVWAQPKPGSQFTKSIGGAFPPKQ